MAEPSHASLGDVIRSMNKDAEIDPPKQGAQIPADVRDLADKAADAFDDEREARAVHKMAKDRLSEAKANLTAAMSEHKLAAVPLADRKPITLTVTKESRKATKGALKGLVGKEGLDWLTAERVEDLWKALPMPERKKLDIPVPPDQPANG